MGILDIIFPKKCAGCGKNGTYFCTSCILSSKLCFPQVCPICGRNSVDGVIHKWCERNLAPDGLISIWTYEGVPRSLILKLKYKYVSEIALSLAVPAAGIFKQLKRNSPSTPNWNKSLVLVPVPLHWTRKNWRGFNQIEEIGKILSQLLGWRIEKLLVRTKIAKQQVGLKGIERKKNVQGVFRLTNNLTIQQLSEVVLFDDVWTTGATMLEAAKVLKKAGIKRVWCLTLAR